MLESKHYDLAATAFFILAALIWSFAAGRDLNWDQINYHFYLPYGLFENRLQQDFVPASGQSYLNPLAYIPFYLMVTNGWPSLVIGSVLATLHAANIILVYYIALSLLRCELHERRVLATLAAAFAFVSPVFLMEIGTTFADVFTAPFMLGAILLVLRADGATITKRKFIRMAAAGFLAGFAVSLKLSNLVFFPALVMLCLWLQRGIRIWFIAGVAIGSGFLIGLAAAHGYWGYQLWTAFGNPFLPFFSNYFPADVFPLAGAAHERFKIESLSEAVTLPFRMAMLRSYVYIENVAPDLRYIAFIFVSVIALGKLALARFKVDFSKTIDLNRTVALFACFVLSFGLWLWTSGNGRYGLVVSLLCAPVIVTTILLITSQTRHAIMALVSILLLHSIHLNSGDLIWDRGPWTRTWYEISVPERLKTEPYLYITANGNSLSFLHPFLARESSFTNPIGQISFDYDREGGRRLKNIIERHKNRVRVISIASQNRLDDTILKDWVYRVDLAVSRLGFGVDGTDCESIITRGAENKLVFQSKNSVSRAEEPMDRTMRRIITCRLYERPFELDEERRRVTRIAEKVVNQCPHLFKPAYTVLERTRSGWSAQYPSTDAMLVFDNQKIMGVFSRSSVHYYLGTQSQWENGQGLSCKELPARPSEVFNFY
jgi:hypothetical protein